MKKALVAYFSAGGVTAGLALRLAKAVGGESYEIAPKVRYTEADLDWRDSGSRSTLEMKDRSCRPEIEGGMTETDAEVVFLGFPIWWYREPSVIDTFVESLDLSGKTIVPFATSGGSGMGETSDNLQKLLPKATVAEGKRFSPDASESELLAWAKQWL